MIIKLVRDIKSRQEAQSIAMAWQTWQSKQNLSYGEIAEWHGYFLTLANKFRLKEEFKENCII
jgi:ribosomal protein L35AE/L33A